MVRHGRNCPALSSWNGVASLSMLITLFSFLSFKLIFSPLYIPAFNSSILENGKIGTLIYMIYLLNIHIAIETLELI